MKRDEFVRCSGFYYGAGEEDDYPDNLSGCNDVKLTEDHRVGTSKSAAVRRAGLEAGAGRYKCPDCGAVTETCMICKGHGYMWSESTGEWIPCHNCNQQEIAERRRRTGRRY